MFNKTILTKILKKKHTLLVPEMSRLHYDLLSQAMGPYGYNLVILGNKKCEANQDGIKFDNTDSDTDCESDSPLAIHIEQILKELKSGKFDISSVSVMISQASGGLMGDNHIRTLKKALKSEGFENIPVISFDVSRIGRQPGFRFSLPMMKRIVYAMIYADLLTKVGNRIRPYEKILGSTNLLLSIWVKKCKISLKKARFSEFVSDVNAIAGDFDFLGIDEKVEKPRIGIVGVNLIDFYTKSVNEIVEHIEKEGAEAVIPGFSEAILHAEHNNVSIGDSPEMSKARVFISKIIINYIENLRAEVNKAIENTKRFSRVPTIQELAKKASRVLLLSSAAQEGWLLTAEILAIFEEGVEDVICGNSFELLTNHVTGKAMLKQIRKINRNASIVFLDFEQELSDINQLDRITAVISEAIDKIKVMNAGNNKKRLEKNG